MQQYNEPSRGWRRRSPDMLIRTDVDAMAALMERILKDRRVARGARQTRQVPAGYLFVGEVGRISLIAACKRVGARERAVTEPRPHLAPHFLWCLSSRHHTIKGVFSNGQSTVCSCRVTPTFSMLLSMAARPTNLLRFFAPIEIAFTGSLSLMVVKTNAINKGLARAQR